MGGIGTAVCVELAKAGHMVVAAYHRQFDKPEAWLAEQKAAGFDFIAVAGDVSDIASCQAMVAEAEAEANAGPIDILVNNAGITRDRMLANMEKDQWDAGISLTLIGLQCVQSWSQLNTAESMARLPFEANTVLPLGSPLPAPDLSQGVNRMWSAGWD
jgi:acetoacetyl-CoA reductase